MRKRTRTLTGCVMLGILLAGGSSAQNTDVPKTGGSAELVRAALRADRAIVQAGRPVWVEFSLTNFTPELLSLRVAGAETAAATRPATEPAEEVDPAAVGLPLSHVFSGSGVSPLRIEDDHGGVFGAHVSARRLGPASEVVLAPHGSIGRRVELTQYCDSLRRPGVYKVSWRPYDGAVEASPLSVTILAERQAVIRTDLGEMTVRFYYEQAPNHVQAFIDAVKERFYDNLTFHRIVAGGLIQGGDPRGDGRGVRDGKRLKAEFSDIPFECGTVGMARSQRDPDSASCQFFICLSRQPSFDGTQTAFGYLWGAHSFETLRRLGAVPTGPGDVPLKPVYTRAISLENVPAQEREAAGSSSATGQAPRHSTVQPGGGGRPASSVGDESDLLGMSAVRKGSASRPARSIGG